MLAAQCLDQCISDQDTLIRAVTTRKAQRVTVQGFIPPLDDIPRFRDTGAMDDPLPPPDGIPPDVWNTWSLAARVLITTLVQQVAALTTRVQDLEQRLAQTSQNSSKPHSSDPPSAPLRPAKTPRGRPRGGQPDHPGATRERRETDTIVPLRPTACPQCATTLAPTLPDATPPQTTQGWELPPIILIVTDYV